MARMVFSQIQQAPGPDFREVGKSLNFIIFFFIFTENKALYISCESSAWQHIKPYLVSLCNINKESWNLVDYKNCQLQYFDSTF